MFDNFFTKIQKWFKADHTDCLERESDLTNVIKQIVEDFNTQSKSLEDEKEACEKKIDSLEEEIEVINHTLALKIDELYTLNNKLNTYTMNNVKVLEKLPMEVYIHNDADINLHEGVTIDLHQIIKKMKEYNVQPLSYIDKTYQSVDKSMVVELLKLNRKNMETQLNDYECNAFILKGMFSQEALKKYAFGWARSSNHTFNFFIDTELNIWIVEPKSSSITKYEELLSLRNNNSKDYKITSYLI